MELKLTLEILSDCTFSSGGGSPGEVDTEIRCDEWGIPYIHGRTLKGLLLREAELLINNLEKSLRNQVKPWEEAKNRLFGRSGVSQSTQGILYIGNATFPEQFITLVRKAVKNQKMRRREVLRALTTIRHSTAIDSSTGAAEPESLRSERLLRKEVVFEAILTFREKPTPIEFAFLAGVILSLHTGGSKISRGCGKLLGRILNEKNQDQTQSYFTPLEEVLSN